MDEKYRRPVVAIASTAVGLLVILMNQPLVMVVAATLATGIIAMLVTGGIRIQLRKGGSQSPEEEKARGGKPEKKSRKERKKEKKARKAAKEGEKEKKSSGIFSRIRKKSAESPAEEQDPGTGAADEGHRSVLGYLASFGAAMKSLGRTGVRSRSAGGAGEIDRTLDRVIADVDDEVIDTAEEADDQREESSGSDDPLAELDDISFDHLDPDQEIIEYPIPGGGTDAPPSEEMVPASEVSKMMKEASRTAHIIRDPAGKDTAVSDILAAYADDLKEDDELPDMGIQEASPDDLTLDSLDDIDEDEEIVIEGDGSTEPDPMAGEAAVTELAYEEYEDESDPGSDEDAGDDTRNLVSFATGETEDSMISLLKEEVGVKKKKVDTSLVRELKGTRIRAEELETELEEMLGQMGHGGA